jgi:hypothetical protein
MLTRKSVVVCVIGSVGMLLLSGCMFSSSQERTSNQGGSSAIQAGAKLSQDRLDTLNPDDIQVLADLYSETTGTALPEVTDEQAAAAVSFMQANNITTVEDLENAITQYQADPTSIVIPADVRAVLESLSAAARR